VSLKAPSLKLRLNDPEDPGRDRDRDLHGLGDSCVASGDGNGVISVNAFRSGELRRDPLGDNECMLAADSVVLKLPPR
jgi:hypothetical protein